MKTILVTGANGQLGNEMRIITRVSNDHYLFTDVNEVECVETLYLDITDLEVVRKMVSDNHIDAIVNCAATGCKHVIIRTAWLYSEFGKNFCKTMMHLTATKPQLKVVFDQVGTPTYALDLAKAIVVVLERFDGSQPGVYHYSNEGVCSWYDFTKMIAEYNGTTGCDVQPCHSDEFPSPVKRPSYSVLDKTKIKEVFGVKVPYWTDSLKQCISNIKS